MPDGREEISVQVVTRIADIPAAVWDACAGTNNPFVSHAFLNALESSGSVSSETGWLPQHLFAADESGRVAACIPTYLKNHSYGEYIFDWGWAEAYERAGGNYYPKLQSAVPFTPAMGPRLLLRPDVDDKYFDVLTAGMIQLARQHNVSSLHVTFPTEDQWQRLGETGFLKRTSKQFHWENRGYDSFDQFLEALNSRKRKTIKKERRRVTEQGITLHRLTGDDVKESHWDIFYGYYVNTIDRKWGRPYLTREFFSTLGDTMADLAVLVIAEHDG
ncbi:MAG: GNAT family N-acetyltransferase, partial [Rhodospirillaceae bacterium]|nr:GNAT family N-acetyltransferase [Rhodospirillaceae bacterium]